MMTTAFAMRMSACFLAVCMTAGSVLAAKPAASKIVHIALRATASVQPDVDGFFSLGSVADLAGGAASLRAKLSAVTLGRAPLPDSTRDITLDDVALKLRQAGIDPNQGLLIEGAKETVVSLAGDSAAPPASNPALPALSLRSGGSSAASAAASAPQAKQLLVHRGEDVTIVVQDENVTITAHGQARQDGALGDAIQVHRDGVMTDVTVTVVDVRTVQLDT